MKKGIVRENLRIALSAIRIEQDTVDPYHLYYCIWYYGIDRDIDSH